MAGDDTGLTKLRNFCVGIGYIGWESAGSKCFAGSVSPGACKVIICSGEFKCGAGFEACQA